LGGGDHDDSVVEHELRMHDAAIVPFDLDADFKPERLAEPVDRLGGVFVIEGRRDSRPAGWRRFHGFLLNCFDQAGAASGCSLARRASTARAMVTTCGTPLATASSLGSIAQSIGQYRCRAGRAKNTM